MTDHEVKIRRGNDARHVLEHPLTVEALNAIRADVYAKIEATGWSDQAQREALYHQLRAINNFEAQFRYHINEGKLASSMLAKMRAEREARKARRGS